MPSESKDSPRSFLVDREQFGKIENPEWRLDPFGEPFNPKAAAAFFQHYVSYFFGQMIATTYGSREAFAEAMSLPDGSGLSGRLRGDRVMPLTEIFFLAHHFGLDAARSFWNTEALRHFPIYQRKDKPDLVRQVYAAQIIGSDGTLRRADKQRAQQDAMFFDGAPLWDRPGLSEGPS